MDFSPEFLNDLQKRLPISEVVSKRVALKKAGREWKGLSPFSSEKTPSLFVNDQKMQWFDFASGRNGNIFDFVMATENVSFEQAVELLAVAAGVSMPTLLQGKELQSKDSRDDLRNWLRRQPYQISIAYTARAALRALPELAVTLGPRGAGAKEVSASLLLPAFRASAAAWAISRFPERALSLRSAAASAAEAAFAAASQIDSAGAVSACVAAARAAAAAARAAADSPGEGDAAAQALETAFEDARRSPNVFEGLAATGAITDRKALEEGIAIEELVRRKLWLDGIPSPIAGEWDILESALLATPDSWEVWTEWYKARLNGYPVSHLLEVARARLPLDIWAQGPRVANAQIKRLIQEDIDRRANPQPFPLENIPSPFAFQVSELGTIGLIPSPANWPSFPHLTSKRDHADRLDVCRTLARDLISELSSQRFQARQEYSEGLEKYSSRLPNRPGEGNILLADAEARTLRNLFAAERDVLSIPFAAKLKTFLEQHMGLRVFYPDLANFYRDVQSGRIEEPLPLDAIEGIVRSVSEGTPVVFERSVQEAIEGSAKAAPAIASTADTQSQPLEVSQPLPPKDPLGDVDPQKASDFTFAGVTNGLWKAFLQGEKIHKAVEGWSRAGNSLRPHVNEVLNWLHRFMGSLMALHQHHRLSVAKLVRSNSSLYGELCARGLRSDRIPTRWN